MFAVVVTFEVAPGKMAEFLPLISENARASLADEPGCHRFDVCTDPAREGEVFLYEIYEDEAAFETHQAMPHFSAFNAQAGDMIAAKEIKTYAEVGP